MTYLIIALVVGLALAPLLRFLPSRRQRELAALRECAALGGLFVEFRQVPGIERLPGVAAGNLIYYGLRLPAAASGRVERAAWVFDDAAWRPVGGRTVTPGALSELPATVRAASVDSGSCGVYWTEDGGEQEVAEIRSALVAWSAALTP